MEEVSTPKKSLKKNYVYNLINQVLVLIVPLITAPYLARVLMEEGNGQLSYAQSIITYFTLFANLGFAIYGQREIARKRDSREESSKAFYEIILLRTFFTILACAVWVILLLTVGFGEKYNQLIWLLGIQIGGVIFDITFYYQGVENFRGIALRSILVKVIGLVCIFVFVKTSDDLWKYALSLSLITVFSNLIMWPSVIRKLCYVSPKKFEFKKHLGPAFMIFLPTLAVTIYSVLDKTMIGLLSANPDYDNGCYEQAYKINSMALVLVTVISPIMIPRNAYDYSQGNMDSLRDHIYFSSSYVWLTGLPLIAGFGALSWNLSSWFLGDGYTEVPIMMIIMSVRFIASGFGVTFGDQLFIAIGKEKYCTIATTAAALVNLGLNFIFIHYWGGVGAAITTAIAEVLVTFILGICVYRHKYVSIRHILALSIKNFIAALVMYGVLFLMQHFMPYAIWSFLVITLAGCIVYAFMLILLRDKFFLDLIHQGWNIVKTKLAKFKKTEE